ncbi:MAG: endonuclease/exonuclease/phosphatase family protein [Chthoniobacterales bacterium]
METFKVATFNMQFGQAWDEKDPDGAPVHLSSTVDFLHSLNADIFLLQEVERAQPGGVQANPPPNYTFLREKLKGYDSVFAYPPINPEELPFGIALGIFSRWQLHDFVADELPPPDIEFHFDNKPVRPSHRQLISATTNILGREVRLMNTHLQAFFMIAATSNEFPTQRNIIEQALRDQSHPTILGGDFNCSPEEHIIDQFHKAGYHTAQNEEITWRRRPYVLDHLFYNTPLHVVSRQVVPTLCSDHHAVIAEFSFGGAQ